MVLDAVFLPLWDIGAEEREQKASGEEGGGKILRAMHLPHTESERSTFVQSYNSRSTHSSRMIGGIS